MSDQQEARLQEGAEVLQYLAEWGELTQEECQNVLAQLDQLQMSVTEDLIGLKKLLAHDYDINSTIEELKGSIKSKGQERRLIRWEAEHANLVKENKPKMVRSIALPITISSAKDLDSLIRQLQDLKAEMGNYAEVELTIRIQEEK